MEKPIQFTIHIRFSEEDGEYVATCDEYPSLSWLDDTEANAWYGVAKLITKAIADNAYGSQKCNGVESKG
jgi:hypothetical protein